MNKLVSEGRNFYRRIIYYFISDLLDNENYKLLFKLAFDIGSFLNNENWIACDLFSQILVVVTLENENLEEGFCERIASASHFTSLFSSETILELFSINKVTLFNWKYLVENEYKPKTLAKLFPCFIATHVSCSEIIFRMFIPDFYRCIGMHM